MRRLNYAVSALAAVTLLVISSLSASAKPIASGSNCTVNWVNNEGALGCFIQGEEDGNNGVSHPHYVACSAAGETFCCVDDDQGHQDCQVVEAVIKGGRPIQATQLGAILVSQQTILTKLSQMSKKVDSLESKMAEQNRK
jgi:hypothetical protein